jgi:hypothetical protein
MSALSAKRSATEAGLGDAAATIAPPPPQPQPPDDYSDLAGMLTHPDLGGVILGWISNDTRSATALRGASRGCRDGVAAHAWADVGAVIRRVGRWRSAFPAARAANVSFNKRLCDADFVHFRGLRSLDMTLCNQPTITDAAFVHLAGIHTLHMGGCRQITDGAFAHLRGIHTLNMSGCRQASISDAVFAHLEGIHTLFMWGCNPTITDAALSSGNNSLEDLYFWIDIPAAQPSGSYSAQNDWILEATQ